MENSDVSCDSAKRHISGIQVIERHKMRCTHGINNDSTTMMHRQQLVLQAMAATCSVDLSSHKSSTETQCDLSTICAYEYNHSATCASDCDDTLRESHINNSHTWNSQVGPNPKPWRFEQWKIQIKTKRRSKEKRRRLRQ